MALLALEATCSAHTTPTLCCAAHACGDDDGVLMVVFESRRRAPSLLLFAAPVEFPVKFRPPGSCATRAERSPPHLGLTRLTQMPTTYTAHSPVVSERHTAPARCLPHEDWDERVEHVD